MIAEVLSIGDELTSGQRLDTNSQWLSQQLADLGIRTLYHTTVADDLAANVRVFRTAADRADVIVATGGLGPTADDLTRYALADVLGVELALDSGALSHIESLFAHRRRPMSPNNRVQAMFPVGSRILPNPFGSAPGIDVDIPRAGGAAARFFALPGVPAEMKEMWQASVRPALVQQLGSSARTIVHRVIRCFGVGESDLEMMLPDLIARGRTPTVGITASQATLSLRITAEGATRDEALATMEPTVRTIYECLGNIAFGEGEDELQHAVVRILSERGLTLATVEHGTGGLVADWLSEASGVAGPYRGGEVVRGLVDNTPDTVKQLAADCRARWKTDLALAIGPFPPIPETGQTFGEVHYALANDGGVLARSAVFAGHPDLLKARSGKQALNHLRLSLLA